jgi:hypothetical protein
MNRACVFLNHSVAYRWGSPVRERWIVGYRANDDGRTTIARHSEPAAARAEWQGQKKDDPDTRCARFRTAVSEEILKAFRAWSTSAGRARRGLGRGGREESTAGSDAGLGRSRTRSRYPGPTTSCSWTTASVADSLSARLLIVLETKVKIR